MTNPVQSTSSVPSTPATTTAPQGRSGAQAANPAPAPFTVEIAPIGASPVYVYRMTDTATGRVLVEIPNDPASAKPDAPGAKVDAKV